MVPGFKFATAKPAEGGSLLPDDSVPW